MPRSALSRENFHITSGCFLNASSTSLLKAILLGALAGRPVLIQWCYKTTVWKRGVTSTKTTVFCCCQCSWVQESGDPNSKAAGRECLPGQKKAAPKDTRAFPPRCSKDLHPTTTAVPEKNLREMRSTEIDYLLIPLFS